MIRQWTRVLHRPDGSIVHVCSQDFPFADGYDPVEENDPQGNKVNHGIVDFELDLDIVKTNNNGIGGRGQEMVRARKILENFEVKGNKVMLKQNAAPEIAAKVKRVGPPKDIFETNIRAEMAHTIRGELVRRGSSEKAVLDKARENDRRVPDKIQDLSTNKVLNMFYELDLMK